MIYNPIFEEEKEKKQELKVLKRAIRVRSQKEYIKQLINRVYNLFQSKQSRLLNSRSMQQL